MFFLMRAKVQGTKGAVPVHLNELSPENSRGTFPGFVYQRGNPISSVNAILQAAISAPLGRTSDGPVLPVCDWCFRDRMASLNPTMLKFDPDPTP